MISNLAHVDPSAKIGNNVTIMPFAFVDKNVEIGDDSVIMPYAGLFNGTIIGKRNTIYCNAMIGVEPQDFHYKGDDSKVIIGDDNKIRENVVIARGTYTDGATRIGDGNFIMEKVHICHDVVINNRCVIGIGTIIAGNCFIEDEVIMSNSVVLHQNNRIGTLALIQSGCRVQKDVPPYIITSGNPVTYHGVNAVILERKHVGDRIMRHIANAYRLIFSSDTSLQDVVIKIEEQIPKSDEINKIIDFVGNSKHDIIQTKF